MSREFEVGEETIVVGSSPNSAEEYSANFGQGSVFEPGEWMEAGVSVPRPRIRVAGTVDFFFF